jgi:hypothetical protein
MTRFRRTYDPQSPVGMVCLDARPSLQKPIKSLLGVNPSQGQQNTFTIVTIRSIGNWGDINTVRNYGNGRYAALSPYILVFASARHMDTCCGMKRLPLKEAPEEYFFD